ncbi:hypothetical protein QAD02_022967 [Eretmocerus hayati]|uniref:Uncharacterized protein n=1 Tax=Eretmocerus hayati TaxID=131215 RepID=A0ACC2PUK0_9HYME|nr:hypothetical protein QAD02_022967 [Eretmocerus hayati]
MAFDSHSQSDSQCLRKSHLLEAIRKGNKTKVKILLEKDDYNLIGISGEDSLLHVAICFKNLEIIKLLLSQGSTVTAEIFPRLDDNLDITKLLLQHARDINERDALGFTYLHKAIQCNLCEIVEILISKGADLNAKTNTKQTTMELAFSKKNDDIIRLLLKNGVDVSSQNGSRDTCLHHAIEAEKTGFAEMIIEEGADVNAFNKFRVTPLHLAVEKNNIDLVKILLKCKVNVNCKTVEKRSPLHIAAMNKFIEIAQLLLDNGSSIDSTDENLLTPLHMAVRAGSEVMVELLLDNHASVNVIGLRDETPLNIAIAYEHEEIAKMLISKGAVIDHGQNSDMLLHMAALNMNNNLVELLLKNGADLTVKYRDGRTALHLAASNKCFKIVELLLEKGMKTNDQTNDGDTALHIAARNKDYKTIRVLLKYGSNIDLKNNLGETALYLICENGMLDLVIELLNLKPSLEDNASVLHHAVSGSHKEYKQIILELICYGFSLDFLRNYEADQVFDFMAKSVCNGHSGIVEKLLCSGYSPNVTPDLLKDSENHKTLLHIAVIENQLQIAKSLISFGGDVNAIDDSGAIPIIYAIQNGNYEMTKLLLDSKTDVSTNLQLFFLSVKLANRSIIEELVSHVKDINAADEFGTTALHFAVWNGDEESVQLLFDKGAKCKSDNSLPLVLSMPEIQSRIENSCGVDAWEEFRKNIVTTPLHIAARNNNSDIVEVLVENGFRVDCKDGCGRTPLHLASLHWNTGVIDTLIEFNSDLHATDELGQSCLNYSNKNGQFSPDRMDHVYSFIYNVENSIGYDFEDQLLTSKLLIKYLARHHLDNVSLHEKLLMSCSEDLKKYYVSCVKEIDLMRGTSIVSNVSYYDFLTKNINALASYLKNPVFLQFLEDGSSTFPLYKNILHKRMRRAKERRVLLDEAEFYILKALCLPDLIVSKIMTYLNNTNLRCIKQAYELPLHQLEATKCKES